jgi:predicted enzyme related to lactoylglutathione lyase
MKTIFVMLIAGLAFTAGYAFNEVSSASGSTVKKVTGIGGVFFRSKYPQKMKDWYSKHLGLNTDTYGTNFEWRQGGDTTKKGFTLWAPFKETTKYFGAPAQQYMINYRVENLSALLNELREAGVTIVDSVEHTEYGKFVHILDCEQNRIELWEPDDVAYDKLVIGRTK